MRRETRIESGGTKYRCGRCNEFFPFDGFYKNSRTLLGIKSECKGCHVATSISSRNADLARSTNSAYMARARLLNPERFRQRERIYSANRRKHHPEKVAARAELNKALNRGDLVKPIFCESCDQAKRLTGHHDDYSKPLSVQWLCYACHGRQHRKKFTTISGAEHEC